MYVPGARRLDVHSSGIPKHEHNNLQMEKKENCLFSHIEEVSLFSNGYNGGGLRFWQQQMSTFIEVTH